MGKFNSLLSLRLKQKDKNSNKMTALAQRSNSGQLSGFSGVFRISELSDVEKEKIKDLLSDFGQETSDLDQDFQSLIALTSEVKAITNQAVILHGERIKKAQTILKSYKEGAFTAWLMATYGNRQTPYNFLQYYDFYTNTSPKLQPVIDSMPRQAIYTLASRPGDQEKKEEIIKNYKGETKQEVLTEIRKVFPLPEQDKRNPILAPQVINLLKKAYTLTKSVHYKPSDKEKAVIEHLFVKLQEKI